jgi:hypothetical protein
MKSISYTEIAGNSAIFLGPAVALQNCGRLVFAKINKSGLSRGFGHV